MPRALLVGASRCKNEQHVADGDDGFNKQDDTDPARDARRHERQYGQSRYNVAHPLEAIQARINAGIARAKERGTRSGRPIGRPSIPPEQEQAILSHLRAGTGILKTARLVGVGSGTVQRSARLWGWECRVPRMSAIAESALER